MKLSVNDLAAEVAMQARASHEIGCDCTLCFNSDALCEHVGALTDLLSLADQLAEAAREAKLQIEYLSDKFAPTGTGNAILAKLNERLAAWDAARKGVNR